MPLRFPGIVFFSLLAVFLLLAAGPAPAEEWPQWRGPHFNGASREKGLPVRWNGPQAALWQAELPGRGASVPVVWKKRVFITANQQAPNRLWALCFDSETGKLRWRLPAGKGFFGKTGNTAASPSPVTNGNIVVFAFGTGELIGCTVAGQRLWSRNLQREFGRFHILWKYGSSPLLYGNRLYVEVIHQYRAVRPVSGRPQPASYLLCLAPETGRTLWRCIRETDAVKESAEAYTTPIPFVGANGLRIIVAGGDYLTAHDPITGRETWRSPDLNPRKRGNFRLVPTPVVIGGTLFACINRGRELAALAPPAPGGGQAARILWHSRRNAGDVCSPLALDGKLFVLDGRRKRLIRLAPETGKIIWQGHFPSRAPFQASPTGADGKIYCLNLAGEVFVASAGPEFRILARVSMPGKGDRAAISVAHHRLFIRSGARLYCISGSVSGRPQPGN